MITVVTRWDSVQMSAELEWRKWRQLKGAFGIDRFIFTPVLPEMLTVNLEQYDTMEECLLRVGPLYRAFLEPTGYNPLGDLPQGDIVLVLGNTEQGNTQHATLAETYKISSPNPTVLYGTNAAAIALAIRHGQ